MRSGPTLPRGPGSMASIATCTWLMKNGCRMLRASIFSSVVWKKMLSLVRTTVPLGMRISEVVRFVKRSSPTALDSSVREPVAGPLILPLIGAVSVCAAMSPPGPARRSNSTGPSGDVAGATTTVAYGATTARRIAPAAKRLDATARVRRSETRGRGPSDAIVARATRRASVSRSVGSSSRRSSAARPAKAGMCTDAASERARASELTTMSRRRPARRRRTSKKTGLRTSGAPAGTTRTMSALASASSMRRAASRTVAPASRSITVRLSCAVAVTRRPPRRAPRPRPPPGRPSPPGRRRRPGPRSPSRADRSAPGRRGPRRRPPRGSSRGAAERPGHR